VVYRLRLPVQVGEWLAHLHGHDPVAGTEVAAALVALMSAEELPGPPLVTIPTKPQPQDAREVLDYGYHELLEHLGVVRRRVAHIASRRRAAELLLETMREDPDVDPVVLADSERQVAEARQLEDQVTGQVQRLQARVDAFRTRKEVLKATYTAKEAQARIREAFEELGEALDEVDDEETDAAAEEDDDAVPEQAAPGLEGSADSDIQVLTADPFGADIGVLFAVEPPGTITVLTVLEGRDTIEASMGDALDVAGELLGETRAEAFAADADEDWQAFGGTEEFLTWLAPERNAAIARRAATLATAVSLRDLREGRGLSLGALASLTGLSELTLADIERLGPRSATVLQYLAAYQRALGVRLELTAVIDGEPHVLF
jgi:hypothetical protein